ncbi:MFS transporter [Bacillus sp. OTU530]|uniref:MFS transporter n=1 Tax=Bacillus sp. OTU530 TaxID=3043862 RepID=UPI00313EB915
MTKPKLWTKNFISISLTSFFIFLIFYMLTVILPIYVTDEMHGNGTDIGIVATVFVVSGILFRPFTGKWFDKYGENIVIYPSILIFAVGVLALSQASSSFMFLLAGGLIGLGFGTISSCFQSIAIKSSPVNRRGTATATYFVLFDSGFAIGSFLLGIIAANTSYANVYSLGFFIILLSVVIYYLLHGRKASQMISSSDEKLSI